MSETALDRGWGDPSSKGYEELHIDRVTAGGVTIRLRREVADVFRYLLTNLAEHYPLKRYADDWGYAYRPIRGYENEWAATHNMKYLSNHSWGLAVDLDSSVNPMTRDASAKHEFVRAIVEPILTPFSGRLIWGGDYTGTRKDYMHLEYVGTPAEAKADSAKARRLVAPPAAPVSAQAASSPTPVNEENDMIIHSPSHSYVLFPAWKKIDPKHLPLYSGKLGVKVTELSDAEFMQVAADLGVKTP